MCMCMRARMYLWPRSDPLPQSLSVCSLPAAMRPVYVFVCVAYMPKGTTCKE